jgi:6,7-dimethyl-8-ribityllumazine synthase
MLESARRELLASGLDPADLHVVEVPGAFEIPLVARRLARHPEIDAVLCFGLVLRGETTHDQYVATAAMQGIVQVSLETDKPILFGVLTCQTLEQARARARPAAQGGQHDKGREVARAAVEMLAALDVAAHLEPVRERKSS